MNKDIPIIHLNFGGIPGFNLFGILDGHGPDGHLVSRFLRNYFIKIMIAYIDFCKKNGIKEPENIYYELKRTKYTFLYEAYNQEDTELAKHNLIICSVVQLLT